MFQWQDIFERKMVVVQGYNVQNNWLIFGNVVVCLMGWFQITISPYSLTEWDGFKSGQMVFSLSSLMIYKPIEVEKDHAKVEDILNKGMCYCMHISANGSTTHLEYNSLEQKSKKIWIQLYNTLLKWLKEHQSEETSSAPMV